MIKAQVSLKTMNTKFLVKGNSFLLRQGFPGEMQLFLLCEPKS